MAGDSPDAAAGASSRASSGELRTWLLSVHPYVRLRLHERLLVWGLLGYAPLGELRLDAADAAAIDTGAGMLMGAVSAGFREWSAGATLTLDPDPPGRGLALRVAPSWGTAVTGAQALWSLPDAAALGAAGQVAAGQVVAAGRLDAELSYGLLAAGGGTATPYLGVAHSAQDRTWRAGARFSLEPELGLKLALEATRREPAHGAAPEHTLTVHATVGW